MSDNENPRRPTIPIRRTQQSATVVDSGASPVGSLRESVADDNHGGGWTARLADTGSFVVSGALEMGHVLIVSAPGTGTRRVESIVQSEGFEVTVKPLLTRDAWELLPQRTFDVVLIILRKDDAQEGIEVGRTLLQSCAIPLVLLTDDISPTDLRRARELGPDTCLTLPASDRAVVTACVAALRRQRSSQLSRWLDEALNSRDDAMAVVDTLATDSVLRLSNASFRRRFGKDHVGSCTELVRAVMAPSELHRAEAVERALIEVTELRFHTRCADSNGEAFQATLWVRPIRERDGFCRFVLFIVEDLTQDLGFEDARRLRGAMTPMLADSRSLLNALAAASGTGGDGLLEQRPELADAASQLDRRLQQLETTLELTPELQLSTNLVSYLKERLKSLSEWFGGSVTFGSLPSGRSSSVDVGSSILDRILFDIASSLNSKVPSTVEISVTRRGFNGISLSILSHGRFASPELFAARLLRPSLGRAGTKLYLLHSARRLAESVGGTLQLLEATEQSVSLNVELPRSMSVRNSIPRRTTTDLLLNPNARSRVVVAIGSEDVLGMLTRLLRKHFLDVVQIRAAEDLAGYLAESTEALNLLITDTDILPEVESSPVCQASLSLFSTRILVVGRPGEVLPANARYDRMPWPFSDTQLISAVVSAIEGNRARLPQKTMTADAAAVAEPVTTAPHKIVSDDELIAEARESSPQLFDAFSAALKTLQVHYQPLVRARDALVVAYEALLRPCHPEFPNPGVLLDVAERLGLIHILGKVIRHRVARDVGDMGPSDCRIFVNLHPAELSAALCDESEPLRPFASRVVYEVTERAGLSSIENLDALLEELRRQGFSFAVDDLGEGYSGLVSLQRLRPEVVKLDMSLVRGIHRSPFKRDLLKTLQVFFRAQHYETVAEGVETIEEANALSGLGVTIQQGFYFAKPGPPWPTL